MVIKILGSGCPKCKKLEENTKEAIKQLSTVATVQKITEFKDIMKHGVMQTPALVINDEIKCKGRVLSVDEIKEFL